MVFIFIWGVAFCIAIAGSALFVTGVVFLFQSKRRPAVVFVAAGLALLLLALGMVGVSIYQINTYCPLHPADCG